MKVKVSTEATEELIEAAVWYELEVPGLGEQLIDTFEQATAKLGKPNPPLVPVIGEAAKLGAKRRQSGNSAVAAELAMSSKCASIF